MTNDDEPILTASEGRAAAALQRALWKTSAEFPVHVEAAAWVARAPKRGLAVARLPMGLAAALAVVLLAVVALWARPAATGPSLSSSATPASSPGHFDNGTFSFDYPTTWRTISGSYSEIMVNEVDVVMGTGDWQTGCRSWSSGAVGGVDCTGDKVDVSGGRVVVKVYRRVGGPAPDCRGGPTANATLGPNAVLGTTDASATTWEIAQPSAQFGWPDNIFVEAHADGPAGLVEAEALVASVRWDPGATNLYCSSPQTQPPSPSPRLARYNADGISFDYPASWPIITGYQHWGIHGPAIEFAVGTGTADAGCTLTPPAGGTDGGGVTCGGPTIAATGDQVVVVWYQAPTLGMADQLPSGSLPSGETRVTIGGMPAIESHGDGWVKWQVSRVAYIEARWGPDASAGESQVLALVASLRIAPPAKESQTP